MNDQQPAKTASDKKREADFAALDAAAAAEKANQTAALVFPPKVKPEQHLLNAVEYGHSSASTAATFKPLKPGQSRPHTPAEVKQREAESAQKRIDRKLAKKQKKAAARAPQKETKPDETAGFALFVKNVQLMRDWYRLQPERGIEQGHMIILELAIGNVSQCAELAAQGKLWTPLVRR